MAHQAAVEQEFEGAVYRDVVVVGASAGGVEALTNLIRTLPPELPASVLVVLHLLATGRSVLPAILERAGGLPASAGQDGERLERGHLYVAPTDRHMLLRDEHLALTRGPRENGHRPAIDPLFRSAARIRGPRAVGIILSGTLDDGTAGLRLVKERGGVAIVQDPESALYPSMPSSAIDALDVDHVVHVEAMGELLCRLLEDPVELLHPDPEGARDAEPPPLQPRRGPMEGEPSALTCPECGGALWERDEGPLVRFECRVGHTFSPDSLSTEQSQALEAALWSALRGLEERSDLLRRIGRRVNPDSARRYEGRARAADAHATVLREALMTYGHSDDTAEADAVT